MNRVVKLNFEMNKYALKNAFGRVAFKIVRVLFIIGLCFLFLFPVLYMMVTAIQDPSAALDPTSILIPKKFSTVAFKGAITALNYWESIWLTFKISLLSTLATLVSCSLAGYGMARFKFKGKTLVTAIMFLTIIVPPQTMLMSNYLNFRFFTFGGITELLSSVTGFTSIYLLNTEWTFLLPAMFACGLRGGLFILIFRQTFIGLPKELEEAARIDGCGTFKTFLRVMLPLAGSAFITVFLFSFVWHWNDFANASMYFDLELRPLSVMLNQINGALTQGGLLTKDMTAYEGRMYLQAGALLTILPLLIVYVFTQRYFTESIERTGIVG